MSFRTSSAETAQFLIMQPARPISNSEKTQYRRMRQTGAGYGRVAEIMSRSIPGWDQYYLDICKVVAQRSKDPNTQIGSVIVGPNHEIRSTGYNSFPRGIRDDVPERLARPAKYLWIEHAERNAICNAARAGTATEGCTIYVEIMPCMDCARAVVQAGIVQVVVSAERMSQYSSQYYDEHFGMVETLFAEAKVVVRRV